MRFGSKVPGDAMEIRDVNMDFAYGGSFTESSPEAYERLILDVLLGDPPLFPQQRGGRALLEDPRPRARPLGQAGRRRQGGIEQYEPGNWGPRVGARDAGPRRPTVETAMSHPETCHSAPHDTSYRRGRIASALTAARTRRAPPRWGW